MESAAHAAAGAVTPRVKAVRERAVLILKFRLSDSDAFFFWGVKWVGEAEGVKWEGFGLPAWPGWTWKQRAREGWKLEGRPTTDDLLTMVVAAVKTQTLTRTPWPWDGMGLEKDAHNCCCGVLADSAVVVTDQTLVALCKSRR